MANVKNISSSAPFDKKMIMQRGPLKCNILTATKLWLKTKCERVSALTKTHMLSYLYYIVSYSNGCLFYFCVKLQFGSLLLKSNSTILQLVVDHISVLIVSLALA